MTGDKRKKTSFDSRFLLSFHLVYLLKFLNPSGLEVAHINRQEEKNKLMVGIENLLSIYSQSTFSLSL